MHFTDRRLGFSLDLPDGWTWDEQNHPLTFFGPRGHVGGTNQVIQIRVALIDEAFADVDSRERYMTERGASVSRAELGGETNVVEVTKARGTEITAVHDGIQYTVSHSNDDVTNQATAMLMASFRFPAPSKLRFVKDRLEPRAEPLRD